MILLIFYFILQENYTFLNNNNYSNKAIPNSSASVLNGNLGSSNRGSNRIVEDLYAKVVFKYYLFFEQGPEKNITQIIIKDKLNIFKLISYLILTFSFISNNRVEKY